jgi:hypothetical protein
MRKLRCTAWYGSGVFIAGIVLRFATPWLASVRNGPMTSVIEWRANMWADVSLGIMVLGAVMIGVALNHFLRSDI